MGFAPDSTRSEAAMSERAKHIWRYLITAPLPPDIKQAAERVLSSGDSARIAELERELQELE